MLESVIVTDFEVIWTIFGGEGKMKAPTLTRRVESQRLMTRPVAQAEVQILLLLPKSNRT